MKTVLITGAAGFLGYHLCKKWLDIEHQVIAIDNFITGQKQNITELQNQYKDRFQFIEADISKPWSQWQNLVPALKMEQILYVFHFASVASPHLFSRYSLEIMEANSNGLKYAVQFADAVKAKVIFASTSEIYGSLQAESFHEGDWGLTNTFGERACYDESKRFGEALIYSTNRKNGTEHGFIRIFNTYGPRMNPQDERVVGQFMHQALNKKAITIYGDGLQLRSFCYVEDLIDGIYHYATKNITVPINLGQNEVITILDLAKTIKKILNLEVPIVFTERRSDDPVQRNPNLSRALDLLAPWRPKVFLHEGLRIMLDSIRKT